VNDIEKGPWEVIVNDRIRISNNSTRRGVDARTSKSSNLFLLPPDLQAQSFDTVNLGRAI
jgi:hypothetical protein